MFSQVFKQTPENNKNGNSNPVSLRKSEIPETIKNSNKNKNEGK
jgi:hypothetical protein